MTQIKICGVTSVDDAIMCVEEGADAIGINFWKKSPRYCPASIAEEIVTAVGKSTLCVGVFVDASPEEISRIQSQTKMGWVQLHGNESPEMLKRFLPKAYKAFRVSSPEVLNEIETYGGEHVLLDASVAGLPGGTGKTFDWSIAAQVSKQRKLTLAGGLTPQNVAAAIEQVRPYRVDTASGVESAPGIKDKTLVKLFIEHAKKTKI